MAGASLVLPAACARHPLARQWGGRAWSVPRWAVARVERPAWTAGRLRRRRVLAPPRALVAGPLDLRYR